MQQRIIERAATADSQLSQAASAFFATWSEKSVGVAMLLGLALGPVGLLYATAVGAAVMTLAVVAVAFAPMSLALSVPAVALGCGAWAGLAARHHNQALRRPRGR